MFVLFPKRAIILKCIIMGKIPLFYHGVIGRLLSSTHLEPLPLFSTCILYLKPPNFLSVPATQHHPVPPWPFRLHIICWVAIYVILPCIIYPHFLACLLFLDCTGQACCTLDMVWATSGKFGLHVGNMKFHTQNEECICIIVCRISPVFVLFIMCNKYILVMIQF